MLFGKIFYMIHRTISVSFLRDTIRRDRSPSKNPVLPYRSAFLNCNQRKIVILRVFLDSAPVDM